MNLKEFNKGILFSSLGSFWWGAIGVIYFSYFSFIGHLELVIHRCIWTAVMLIITTQFFSKWNIFFKILKNKKNLLVLFFSGLLIFINWAVWIYAVSNDQIIDASFGYFIMPIVSVLCGNIFFREKISFKSKISIFLVCVAIFILLRNFNNVPWVGLIVAFSWAFYNVLRKLINVDTDIGLLIESLYILPMSLIVFYFIFKNGQNDFSLENLNLMFMLLLAGPMTVIPLFLYVRGVELSGLGPSGMIFYITPTLQFLLGYFYYNELFSYEKFFSFTIIWIAVIIYLKDLYEKY